MTWRKWLVSAALCVPLMSEAQTANCPPRMKVWTDSIRVESKRTQGVRRTAVRRYADSADVVAQTCADTLVVHDTLLIPAPPPVVPKTLSLTQSDTLVFSNPTVPNYVLIYARVDSAGVRLTDSVTITMVPSQGSIAWERGPRAAVVHSFSGTGRVAVIGTWNTLVDTVWITVNPDTGSAPPPPPPPTLPPTPVATTWGQTVDSLIGPIPDCGLAKQSPVAAVRIWVQNWETNEPKRWTADSSRWDAANYYDRAATYYAMAACYASSDSVRSALYLARGHALAINYRDKYLLPNDGNIQQHWMQLEGIALHAAITGDTLSKRILGRTTSTAYGYNYFTRYRAFGDTTHASMENRIAQRTVLAGLLSMRYNARGKAGEQAADWARKLDSLWLMTYRGQNPTIKRWCYRCTPRLDSIKLTFPYMDALLSDVAYKYQRWYPNGPQVARLDTLRRTTYEFLLDSAMRTDSTFHYNVTPSTVGSKSTTPDLNLFHVANLWKLWIQVADTRYRDAAAKLFDKGVRKAYLAGSKQFNESYYNSFRYVAYLQGRTP